MRASELLETAKNLVTGNREQTHGPKLENHQNIASLWSAYLGREISPLDVALMMALVKIGRTKCGAHNPDDYVDLIGYGAVAGELADLMYGPR
jgi:hypothetical protein